jgi:patatin-like phospholipase
MSAAVTALFGVPGFFRPRFLPAFVQLPGAPGALSFYDTSALRATLERLVDFDLINNGSATRLSLGAVNVRSGNFVYFDNTKRKITLDHVMASAALPPAFPPVEIEGEYFCAGRRPLEGNHGRVRNRHMSPASRPKSMRSRSRVARITAAATYLRPKPGNETSRVRRGTHETAVHPVVGEIAIGAVVLFIAVMWLAFARGPEVDYLLVIVTLFFVMFFTLFLLTASYGWKDPCWHVPETTFARFLQSDVRTATGTMRGRNVLIEIATLPISLAIGAMLIGLAWAGLH